MPQIPIPIPKHFWEFRTCTDLPVECGGEGRGGWRALGEAVGLKLPRAPSPHLSGECRGCSGSSAGIAHWSCRDGKISLLLLSPWRLENKSSAETPSQHRETSCCILEKHPCSSSLRNSQNPRKSSRSPLFPTLTCACQGELGGEFNSIPGVHLP